MKRRTFAEIQAQLEAMPVTSAKYRLLAALYDGLLTDGMRPDSLEKLPDEATRRSGYARGADGVAVKVR